MLADRITLLEKKLVYYRIGMSNNCQATNYKFPLDFLTAFYAVKDFLEKNNFYSAVERSYVNKALAGCIYNMNSIGDVQAKKAVFDELKKDGFKKLGIEGKNEEYFYNYNKKDVYKRQPYNI